MDGIQQINIDRRLWPAVVPFDTKNPFQSAILAGKKLGLVDTITPYLGEPVEPYRPAYASDNSFRYSNILPIRKTDVMLVTPPKTGTTLMQQLCHQIKNRGGENSMDFDNIRDVSPWLDYVLTSGDDIEALEDPRIFKTHRLLSDSRRGCKYIATIRKPEDIFKSYFAFFQDLRHPLVEICKSASDLVLDTEFLFRKPYGGTLWDYFNEFWKAQEMDDLLVVPYEFLVSDLETVAKKLASFIGEPDLSPTELENIKTNCNKEFMGSGEHKKKFESHVLDTAGRIMLVGRKVNLDEKPELTEAAKSVLAQLWEKEMLSTTAMHSYDEFSNRFRERLLSRPPTHPKHLESESAD